MKSIFCFLLFCASTLSAFDPLNNLDYTMTAESWSYFNRDSEIHITQENQLIGIVKGQWSMTTYANQPAYVLFDNHKNVMAKAYAYREANQISTLFFSITDSKQNLLGTLAVYYGTTGKDRAMAGILYSKEGTPVLQDRTPALSTSLFAYIPGTEHQLIGITADSYFLPYNKMHANISDIPYIAQMNMPPELFLLYAVIRKDLSNYTYSQIYDLNPVYYE